MPIVGKILKAHGLKGELKTDCFLDSPHLFASVKRIFVNGNEYAVDQSRVSGNFVLLKIKNIDTIEQTVPLCGKEILVERKDMPTLSEGRYYIDDLIGCIVMADKERLGKIKDVLQYGAADVIVLTKEGKTIMLPWISGVFSDIDTEKKLIYADKKKFDEVAVYED